MHCNKDLTIQNLKNRRISSCFIEGKKVRFESRDYQRLPLPKLRRRRFRFNQFIEIIGSHLNSMIDPKITRNFRLSL